MSPFHLKKGICIFSFFVVPEVGMLVCNNYIVAIVMTYRKTGNFCFMLIIAMAFFTAAINLTVTQTVAQQQQPGLKSTSDLSDVNWDEEKETGNQPKKSEDLSTVNWDDETDDETAKDEDMTANGELSSSSWEDEDTSESDIADSDGLQALNQKDLKAIESREFMIHLTGFLLFIGYIVGGILTAFITRNRKIAVAYPPELLILLHTFWPLELLLLPFMGKPVR